MRELFKIITMKILKISQMFGLALEENVPIVSEGSTDMKVVILSDDHCGFSFVLILYFAHCLFQIH
ncbi:hypothetical protein SAMN04488525_11115 [Trichococcus collinsii]|uniref:Uncharacterized protein n=1 Tax=Trichococcus collinsii TaxID=157076 RepID=A0AB38A3N6_9LACT|nr:hypothetical protein SAMN04488525_11115 [Trichococcus collinsii]